MVESSMAARASRCAACLNPCTSGLATITNFLTPFVAIDNSVIASDLSATTPCSSRNLAGSRNPHNTVGQKSAAATAPHSRTEYPSTSTRRKRNDSLRIHSACILGRAHRHLLAVTLPAAPTPLAVRHQGVATSSTASLHPDHSAPGGILGAPLDLARPSPVSAPPPPLGFPSKAPALTAHPGSVALPASPWGPGPWLIPRLGCVRGGLGGGAGCGCSRCWPGTHHHAHMWPSSSREVSGGPGAAATGGGAGSSASESGGSSISSSSSSPTSLSDGGGSSTGSSRSRSTACGVGNGGAGGAPPKRGTEARCGSGGGSVDGHLDGGSGEFAGGGGAGGIVGSRMGSAGEAGGSRGGGGGRGSGGSKGRAGDPLGSSSGRRPHPGKSSARIKDAAGLQDLEAAVRQHKTRLAAEPALLATALGRLGQLFTAGNATGGGAAAAGVPPNAAAVSPTVVAVAAAAPPGPTSTTGLKPSQAATRDATVVVSEAESQVATDPQVVTRGSLQLHVQLGDDPAAKEMAAIREAQSPHETEAETEAEVARRLLGSLLPEAAAAAPRMRVGELSSCVWAIGKLRPVWQGYPEERDAALIAVDAVAVRLADDWLQHFPTDGSTSDVTAGATDDPSATGGAAAAAAGPRSPLPDDVSDGATTTTTTTTVATTVATTTTTTTTTTAADVAAAGASRRSRALWSEARNHDVSSLAWGLARCWQHEPTIGASTSPIHGGGGGQLHLAPRRAAATPGLPFDEAAAHCAAAAAVGSGLEARPAHQVAPQEGGAPSSGQGEVMAARAGVAAAGLGGRTGQTGQLGRREAAWQWLAAGAGDVVWSGQPREVANLVWGFTAAGRPEPQVYDNLRAALAHAHRGPALVSQLREEECTMVLSALATAVSELKGPPAASAGTAAPVSSSTPDGDASSAGGRSAHQPATLAAAAAAVATAAAASRGGIAGAPVTRALAQLGPRAAHLALNGRLTGRQISSMLRALAQIQEATGEELEGEWLQILARRAGHKARYMDGQALGDAAWALGKLRVREKDTLRALCVAAVAALRQQREQLLQQQFDNVTGNGSSSSSSSSSASRTTGLGASRPPPPSSADLLRLLWACGRLRYMDEPLLEAVQAHLLPEISSLDSDSLALLTFALAALNYHHPATFTALCKRAHQLLPPQQPSTSSSPSDGPPPDGAATAPVAAATAAAASAPPLTAPQMAALVAALGRVEHYDSALIDELCDRLAADEMLASLRSREVCSVVSALGRMEHPHAALMAAVERHVVRLTPLVKPGADGGALMYTPDQLVVLLYGFAETGTRADRLLARAAAVLRRRLSDLDPEAIARLAESYAVLGHLHDDLFQAIAVMAIGRRQRFSQPHLERIAWAFRSLGYEDSEQLLEEWRPPGAPGSRSGVQRRDTPGRHPDGSRSRSRSPPPPSPSAPLSPPSSQSV